jgi:hypothetical protein
MGRLRSILYHVGIGSSGWGAAIRSATMLAAVR